MWIYAGLWLLVAAYAVGIVVPRMVWVVAGRRCPRCESGRLWFGGLAENPWRRLRSWWRCESCRAEVRELGWGRLEVGANSTESGIKVAAIDADIAV